MTILDAPTEIETETMFTTEWGIEDKITETAVVTEQTTNLTVTGATITASIKMPDPNITQRMEDQ